MQTIVEREQRLGMRPILNRILDERKNMMNLMCHFQPVFRQVRYNHLEAIPSMAAGGSLMSCMLLFISCIASVMAYRKFDSHQNIEA